MQRMKGIFVPLSVRFFRDPKVLSVPVQAKMLYLAALCYAKEEHTDGFVSRASLVAILPGERGLTRAAKQLTDAGLWEEADAGWIIAAWGDWNLSEALVKEKSEKRRAAAKARWEQRRETDS